MTAVLEGQTGCPLGQHAGDCRHAQPSQTQEEWCPPPRGEPAVADTNHPKAPREPARVTLSGHNPTVKDGVFAHRPLGKQVRPTHPMRPGQSETSSAESCETCAHPNSTGTGTGG